MNEKQTNMAERIMKNTHRLLGLINDLLDQAQIEAGKLTIVNKVFRPGELLESVHDLMEKPALDKDLRLTSEVHPSLPPTIIGDALRLQQILVNLVNNSIKFTDQGSIHIRLFSDEVNWMMEVNDTGRGIPGSEIPHIFETFRQVDGADTRSHGGFGLGLSIVQQLVNLMNGTITVKSQPGEGSVFTVMLPLMIPEGISEKWREI
jgi:signal transduction histidine kinase